MDTFYLPFTFHATFSVFVVFRWASFFSCKLGTGLMALNNESMVWCILSARIITLLMNSHSFAIRRGLLWALGSFNRRFSYQFRVSKLLLLLFCETRRVMKACLGHVIVYSGRKNDCVSRASGLGLGLATTSLRLPVTT